MKKHFLISIGIGIVPTLIILLVAFSLSSCAPSITTHISKFGTEIALQQIPCGSSIHYYQNGLRVLLDQNGHIIGIFKDLIEDSVVLSK